ncbi:MAG: hypothetical protein KGJ79_03470 [Alphaproteobacteria bacterium]|nr:hypothetical protein [Alphaproteobacteria bacterium]MDE2110178.1 hypothetical protein [Alphaproteobacteria bacterium]MDE2492512.1 hypothetical protein [Alphaproteobacteria bacterium]
MHEGFFDLHSRKNISDVHVAGHSSSSNRVLLWKRFQEFLAENDAEVTVAFRQAMIRGSATDEKAE